MVQKGFLAVIVILLLALYGVVLGDVICDLLSLPGDEYKPPSDQAIAITTMIGGLVSAVVVAKLASTDPGKFPSLSGTEDVNTFEKIVVGLYLFFWIIIGGLCLWIGTFVNDTEPLINDTGTTWLGIAVAAAYSYFGIVQGTREKKKPGGK